VLVGIEAVAGIVIIGFFLNPVAASFRIRNRD